MQEELKVIQKLGLATSKEVQEAIEKSLRNVIRGLNQLELYGEIKILIFTTAKHRKRLYVSNELYNNSLKA